MAALKVKAPDGAEATYDKTSGHDSTVGSERLTRSFAFSLVAYYVRVPRSLLDLGHNGIYDDQPNVAMTHSVKPHDIPAPFSPLALFPPSCVLDDKLEA